MMLIKDLSHLSGGTGKILSGITWEEKILRWNYLESLWQVFEFKGTFNRVQL